MARLHRRRWPTAGHVARRLLPEELQERVRRIQFRDAGHGFDPFGMTPDWVAFALLTMRPLYEVYFRVTSHGTDNMNVPGGAVFACNHSGTLPFDAMMVWCDMVRKSEPPRVPRAVVDHFVNMLPFVSVLYIRSGAIGGSRGNFHEALSQGEWILVYPEGTPGIGKHFRDRYQLQKWRVGHAELAIRHHVPVVPVAVIGAEEQWPQIARINGISVFGAPYLPIVATPFPLPVHYHIWYGEPLAIHEEYPPEAADDPNAVAEAALTVKAAVQGLIERGLAEREGVFR